MRSKQVAENPKTFVVILDTGDEILSSLKSVAQTERLAGSSFKAIGALSGVELGWFNWETKKYQTAVQLEEQVELLSLIGDIALKDSEPQVHAHLVIGTTRWIGSRRSPAERDGSSDLRDRYHRKSKASSETD